MEIDRRVYERMVGEATAAVPFECCGYLAGVGEKITRICPMKNIDESTIHYSFDPVEQFATVKKIRKENLKILAVYHSHPESPARPSVEDIRLAYDPSVHHVIISLCGGREEVRAFHIQNGLVQPEDLTIL